MVINNIDPMRENNYYTVYKDVIKDKILAGNGKEEMFIYVDKTYLYLYKKRKEAEYKHFSSENQLVWFAFGATVCNAINVALSLNSLVPTFRWMFSVFATCFTAGITLVQTLISKKKYHENWMRHNTHYILMLKECRNFAEDMEEYKNPVLSLEDRCRLFRDRIYHIEDTDLSLFLENTGKLK